MFSWWAAPDQQVRQEQGLEEQRAKKDAATGPIGVHDARLIAGVGSQASARDFSLDDIRRVLAVGQGPLVLMPSDPSNVLVGDSVGDIGTSQPVATASVYATLQGAHNKIVRITSIKARIVSKEAPPSGTLFRATQESVSDDAQIGIDLDSNDLNARTMHFGDTDIGVPVLREHFFDTHQVTLDKDEPVSFQFHMFAKNGLFKFIIDVTTDDGTVTTISNDGKPWVLSSYAKHYDNAYKADQDTATNSTTAVPCDWPAGCPAM